MRRIRRVHVLVAALAAALCVPASGVSSGSSGPSMITKAGKNEGTLNLIAWEGYTYKQWVNPFTKATGCKVHAKYGGSSDEMVTLMRDRAVRRGLGFRRREPASDPRQGRPSDRSEAGAGLQELHPGV